MPLPPKERRFVSEYLVDQNATAAAKRAGYSKKTADVQGPRLLGKVRVKAAVDSGIARVEAKNDDLAARMDAILLSLAEADIRKAFNSDGTMKRMSEMPDDVAAAIASVETDDDGNMTKFKFTEKVRPIELLYKRHRLLVERHEHTGKDGEPLTQGPNIVLLQKLSLPELKHLANMRQKNGTEATH